jgi:hypothetical protein
MTPFMIANRGGCSFVEKVRNMEDAGAAVAIVMDHTNEDTERLVMVDDGTGAGIRIPSMIISKKDGKTLLDWITSASEKEREKMAIMAIFEMDRPDNRVEYDLWFTSSSTRMAEFITDFAKLDT